MIDKITTFTRSCGKIAVCVFTAAALILAPVNQALSPALPGFHDGIFSETVYGEPDNPDAGNPNPVNPDGTPTTNPDGTPAANPDNPGGASDETATPAPIQWPAAPELSCESAVLIEASTGTVLYDKDCHSTRYPASITKIMTALLALEHGNLSDMVPFTYYDVYTLETDAARIYLDKDDELSLKDCLYAIMLASANDASNAVAEYVAKKQPEYTKRIEELQASGQTFDESEVAIQVFADMMNRRATECGALGTHFVNPHGLFLEDHYTTAYDMAMITREAIKNEQFLQIEQSTSYIIPTTKSKSEELPIANRHKMVFPRNEEFYEGILGGKTGYVDQSGNTLVTFAKKNGMILISVVLMAGPGTVYTDTRTLLDYGFNNFTLHNISDYETKFQPTGNSILGTASKALSTSASLISVSKSDNIVLPIKATFDQCSSSMTYADGSSNLFATINYTYADHVVGTTTLTINDDKSNDFQFGPALEQESTRQPKEENDVIRINIWFVLGGIAILAVIALIFLYRIRFKQSVNRNRNSASSRSRSKRGSSSGGISFRNKRGLFSRRRRNRTRKRSQSHSLGRSNGWTGFSKRSRRR